MRRYDEMTYDEQEAWINYAEAEYCPKCYGRKQLPVFRMIDANRNEIVEFMTCPRCLGSGRA